MYSTCDVTALLLERGAIANVVDKNKETPLHYAIKTECETCIRLLINYGASLNARDINGYTPLHLALI